MIGDKLDMSDKLKDFISSRDFIAWKDKIAVTVDGIEVTNHELSTCFHFYKLPGRMSTFSPSHQILIDLHKSLLTKGLLRELLDGVFTTTSLAERAIRLTAK